MSTGEFFGALVAVIVAGTGSTIALAVYLGGRIDRIEERLGDRLDGLSNRFAELHEDFTLHRVDPQAQRR